MSSEYDIKHDDRVYRVTVKKLDEGGLLIVKVGDESFTLKVSENDDGTWCVNDTYTDHILRIRKRAGSKVSLEVNDSIRAIEWSRVRKESTPKPASSGPNNIKKVSGGVYPPMPGKITEVHVSVGDRVKGGQTVCILEAMKMFNELKASSDGAVKEVNIEPGSNVTPDTMLILIE
ncbi:MAG: hypothetical protein EAX81_00020 [Candidatus Thorarchaeota archaeon]|nr:hypothetical protein [Candidatus Thorarchaeota archaeon]